MRREFACLLLAVLLAGCGTISINVTNSPEMPDGALPSVPH